MDKFEELMNEGKMEHEPSNDFIDRVMESIENEKTTPVSSLRARTWLLSTLAVAASLLILVAAFGLLSNDGDSAVNKKQVATNTSTTTSTTLPTDIDPKAKAAAEEVDSVLASFDKELASDVNEGSWDTNKLNDTGI